MVYTIGETVLDIIFKTIDDVKVKPGGSMLNTAISLGRLGVPTYHISTLSTDKASDLLIEFLQNNGVNAEYIYRSKRIKTSLALAYLNELNNAEYSFYKDDLNLKDGLSFPEIAENDIIHFGSFFSINRNVHSQLNAFLTKVKVNGGICIYDPNFRKPHLPMLSLLKPLIEQNISNADIVKGSDEDFENIFGLTKGNDVWNIMKDKGVKVLFYTKGSKGSEIYCNTGVASVAAKKTNVVSTIGAGDTYSAGIIYFLSTILKSKPLAEVSINEWKECIELATGFSRETCKSIDNYLSVEYCKKVSNVQ